MPTPGHGFTALVMNRTDPSHRAKLAPPRCRLQKWAASHRLSSRPGPNLYTNSVVKLDHESGKLEWYRQLLPHDVYDWDLQLPPILADDGDRQLVIAAGKVGYVYGIDAESGELVWKTPVGEHNGHDDDHKAAQAGELDQLPELPVTVLPGVLGGVETQLALAGGVVYAPVVNLATTFESQVTRTMDLAAGTGEVVALDVATGEKRWTTRLPAPPYGAATVSNDLLFTTTFDGTVHAYSTTNGEEVWTDDMKVGSNSPLTIAGDYLFTAAAFPQGKGQKPMFYVYKLGASEITPPASSKEDNTGSKTSAKGDTTKSTPARGAKDFFTPFPRSKNKVSERSRVSRSASGLFSNPSCEIATAKKSDAKMSKPSPNGMRSHLRTKRFPLSSRASYCRISPGCRSWSISRRCAAR